jgi:hypothetical protein
MHCAGRQGHFVNRDDIRNILLGRIQATSHHLFDFADQDLKTAWLVITVTSIPDERFRDIKRMDTGHNN